MLVLDGVYAERPSGSLRFRWVKAPTSAELTALTHMIARRVGRYLERRGLIEHDADNSYLNSEAADEDPMHQLLGDSITYPISGGPQRGRKVFTLQTLPPCEPEDRLSGMLGQVAGFSLATRVLWSDAWTLVMSRSRVHRPLALQSFLWHSVVGTRSHRVEFSVPSLARY